MHSVQAHPPSIDRVLNWTAIAPLLDEYGREPVLAGLRSVLDHARQAARRGDLVDCTEAALAAHLASLPGGFDSAVHSPDSDGL